MKEKKKIFILILALIILFTCVYTIFVSKKNIASAKRVAEENENNVLSEEELLEQKRKEEELLKKQQKRDEALSNEFLIIVNKENTIDSSYEPNDLVIPSIRLKTALPMTKKVRAEVGKALEEMFKAAKKDNITLIGISGYRSYKYQNDVFKKNVKEEGIESTEKYVAVPGTSEHQTGLAIDVLSNEYLRLDEGFKNTKAYRWLCDNMADYGFIIRYPKGKEDITGYEYEPWHIRYVGVEYAKEIQDSGLTLEEYLDNIIQLK